MRKYKKTHKTTKKRKYKKKKDLFYSSKEWKELRYKIILESNGYCSLCGKKSGDKLEGGEHVKLTVDHILPKSIFPELKLYPNNLKVLCQHCNIGKDNSYNQEDLKILSLFKQENKK